MPPYHDIEKHDNLIEIIRCQNKKVLYRTFIPKQNASIFVRTKFASRVFISQEMHPIMRNEK